MDNFFLVVSLTYSIESYVLLIVLSEHPLLYNDSSDNKTGAYIPYSKHKVSLSQIFQMRKSK